MSVSLSLSFVFFLTFYLPISVPFNLILFTFVSLIHTTNKTNHPINQPTDQIIGTQS